MKKRDTQVISTPASAPVFIQSRGRSLLSPPGLVEPSLAESFRESFENPTFILSSIVVAVCAIRFLFDGATLSLLGQTLTFASTDPLAYGSILTPVLAAHGYIRAKAQTPQSKPKVDDPDAKY